MEEKLLHRKTKCRLHITDSQGKPVSNTKISFRQTEHEFLFGCGGFDTISYLFARNEKERAFFKERVDRLTDIFNYSTIPFYWGSYEPEEGKTRAEGVMKAVRYLTDKGLKLKGHPLCWHTVCADWLMKYDNETILKKQLERINREVTGYKGIIDMWDVINEVVIMPIFDKYDNAITRICKEKGRVALIKEVFTAAKEANPDAVLLLNDFNTSISYEILIDGCLEAGVPIDVIGIQSHQHQGYWGLQKLEEVLERYEHFGLPIHFTENTFLSGKLVPAELMDLNDYHADRWPSTRKGEERQKEQMEEMYRTLFAHPLVEAVTNWDLSDGMWLNAPSGIIRRDNSPKPAYEMLRSLIKEEWHTEEEYCTDADGYAEVEGFRGTYDVISGDKCAKITLNKSARDSILECSL